MEMSDQLHGLATSPQVKNCCTHGRGGSVGPRASHDGFRKLNKAWVKLLMY